MDIDKLIEQLRWWADNCDRTNYGCQARPFLLDATTALSTLKGENEKMRAELEQVREKNAGLALALLTECAPNPDCLGDNEWRAIRAELDQVKRDRDSIEQDFRAFAKQWWEEDSGFPCRWCKFERQGGCEWKVKHPGEICAGRAFEWRGQKEDGKWHSFTK